MAPPLLTLQDVDLSFGGTPLLEGAVMSLSHGEKVCLVGRNGAGKSSLLKIAAGSLPPDGGERFLQPGLTVGLLAQAPDFDGATTVAAYIKDELGEEAYYKAGPFLDALSLTGEEETAHLSGGEARRAALVRLLASEPDVLLLDEPTNHLDLPAIEWLEGTLAAMGQAMMIISHDRRFLTEVGNKVFWVDRGAVRTLDAGFENFEAWRDETYAQEEEEAHKLARKIVREEDWLRYGVTARRKRNQRRLRDLHELREKKRTLKGPEGGVALAHETTEKSAKKVLEAQNISKAFGELAVVKDFSLRLMRGEKIGIVGPNGAGKTTLIKLLTGELEPDSGTIELGAGLALASLDQARAKLKPEWCLKDALTSGGGEMVEVGGQTKHVISYMKDFLFTPEQAGTPLSVLSGGELARVMLARALSLPSNMMVLDEPTNDLDLETLDLLEEFLHGYEGTVLLVSHDRDFLDRVVDGVLVFEGQGQWGFYAGGYSQAMQAQKITGSNPQKEGEQQAQPKPEASRQQRAKKAQVRLSYKEKYALETLPGEMEELEVRIGEYQAQLAQSDLYSNDPQKFETLTRALGEAAAALEAKEALWLELEMKREELEGG